MQHMLKPRSTTILSGNTQGIVMAKPVVENFDRIFLAIFLSILSNGYQPTSLFIIHVHCDWHPAVIKGCIISMPNNKKNM